MNFNKDTKGSAWEKEVGKSFYHNSHFQDVLAHPRTGRRVTGNSHAQTYLFWLQVGHEVERAGKVLLWLLGQLLEICCILLLYKFILVCFAALQGRGARQEAFCSMSWSVAGYYWEKEGGKEWVFMARAPHCRGSPWLERTFSCLSF